MLRTRALANPKSVEGHQAWAGGTSDDRVGQGAEERYGGAKGAEWDGVCGGMSTTHF